MASLFAISRLARISHASPATICLPTNRIQYMPRQKHSDQKTAVRALFIGNSFTARNDLPGRIAEMSAGLGTPFEHHLISAGGASLRQHWNAGTALTEITNGRYDFVILQEQSTLPIKNAARMHENIRLFDEAIRRAGSRTVLYLTWARQNAPETQEALTSAYTRIGSELDALIVPVGVVWQRFLAQYDSPVLHESDQSHPTPSGTYLAACVFCSMLFRQTPVGSVGGAQDVAEVDVKRLQTIAWEVCQPLVKASGSK